MQAKGNNRPFGNIAIAIFGDHTKDMDIELFPGIFNTYTSHLYLLVH